MSRMTLELSGPFFQGDCSNCELNPAGVCGVTEPCQYASVVPKPQPHQLDQMKKVNTRRLIQNLAPYGTYYLKGGA